MDFFKQVAKRLEELEELSKQAQQGQADSGSFFRPKGPDDGMDHSREHFGSNPSQDTPRSRQAVSGDSCPVEERTDSREAGAPPRKRSSLLDNLADHLDDALMLQEILGPPRCLREWD